jgi:hypothetical protein
MNSHWGLSDLEVIAKQQNHILELTARIAALEAALREHTYKGEDSDVDKLVWSAQETEGKS